MCRQCETCTHSCVLKGSVRGVMDCDPDDYYCSANNDVYFYMDDVDLAVELECDEDDVCCPDYVEFIYDPYDDYWDRADYYYDMKRDEGDL